MSQHIAAAKQKKGVKAGLLFLLLQLAFFIPGIAQQYPVQGSLAISSPYPAYLSDYANPSIEKLALSLTLTDLNISNKRIRLKLFIQKQSSTIAQSNDNIIGEPTIILDGGVPQRFTSMELANYFKIENLQGINGDAYSQPLPEGVYNIGFEVYDYFTGNKLSDRISQMFWLMLSDPPLLNMPRNHENILDANPNNPQIVFQWTPRTTQVTNTEYEFTLSELWDDAGDPYQQFLAAIPKYQSTTSNTTLLYGLTEPPLLAGRTYAWRVRAKAKASFEDIGLYRQNGYSEIFVFKYAGQCAAVQGVNIEVKGYDRMYITWQPNPNQSLYKVAYRKYTPSNNWEWHETETFNPFLNLFDLEANTDYEIKVGGVCNDGLVSYTTPQTVRTLQSGQLANIKCGQAPVLNLANQALLQHLSANEVVMAGDFPITITRVEGGSGVYNGEGWVKVPWLADTKIKVKYTGIKVNTDYKLLDGYFETTYDPTGANIGDIDGLIDDLNGIFTGGTDVGHVITGSDTTKYHVDFDIPDPCTSCTFTPDGHGGGTITFGNGHTLTVTELPTTIKDANGDIYQVGADGIPIKIGNAGGTGLIAAADKATIDLNKGRVDFAPAAGMVYAFDAWQQAYDNSTSWAKKYEKLNGGAYRVSAKAIAPGKPDKVLARITLIDNTLKADSIKFVNGKGTIYEKKKISETDYEITMTGGPADDAQEIYALYPQGAAKPLNLGKLLVAGYEEEIFNVVLVPVKGNASFDKQRISDSLNKIYNPLNFKIQVTQADNFDDESWDVNHNGLNVSGSNAISVLTSEMKALNKAYSKTHNLEKGTLYLFILNHAADSTLLGDMPRGKQFGYLFTDNNNHLEHTIAHELGHGIFRLKHISEEGINRTDLPDNVMNYPAGRTLSKFQWDIMHDPPFVIGAFENDDDGQEAIVNNIEELAKFKNADGSFTFLSVSGKPLTLKGNLTQVSFITSEDQWSVSKNFFPLGALFGFELNGKKYSARKTAGTANFSGYLDPVSNTYYKDLVSINKTYQNVLVGIICIKDGNQTFKVFPTNFLDVNTVYKTVAAENQGEGVEQDVFFITNFLSREPEAVSLYAQTQKLTPQEIFFLDKYSNDGSLCGAEALYAFKAAYLIRNNEGLLGCLTDAENDANAHVQNNIRAVHEMEQYGKPVIDNLTAPHYVVDYKIEAKPLKVEYKQQYNTKDFFLYFNDILEQYQKTITNAQASYSTLSDQSIGDIIEFFTLTKSQGRTCLLRNIPFNLRCELLKKTDKWRITSSKEELLIDLIETTPDADLQKMLDFLRLNNFERLSALYNDINSSNSDRFVSIISTFILHTNASGVQTLGGWPPPQLNPPQYSVSPFLIIAKDETKFAGNVIYKYNTTANYANGVVTINFTSSVSDPFKIFQTKFTGSPYDLVRVRFISDYRFARLGANETLKEGDEITVPAIWVYWLLDRQNTVENFVVVRVVVDAAAVAASLLIVNPGPLVITEGIVGGADIVFALAEDKIESNGTPEQKEILGAWNTFYAVYGAAVLTRGLVGGIKSFSLNKAAIQIKIAELKNLPQKLREFSADLYGLLKSVKNFTTSGLNLKNLAYSTLLSAYMEVKIATFSRTAEDVQLLVSGGNVIGKAGAYAPAIMKVTQQGEDALLFSNLRWYSSSNGTVSETVGKMIQVRYVNKAGQEVTGDIELIKLTNGQIWVREANVLLSKLERAEYALLKAKVNQFDALTKAKFLEQFIDASDNFLGSLNNDLELVDVWKKWGDKGIAGLEELQAFKRVWTKNTREVTFENFYTKTNYQIEAAYRLGKPGNKKFAAELFEEWENGFATKNVSGMQNVYTKYGLDPMLDYPPCEGIWGITEKRTAIANEVFDRFQYGDKLGGSYASPLASNETNFTIQARALKENYFNPTAEEISKGYYYIKFKIANTNGLNLEFGEAMPWFGKPGGAIQIKSSTNFGYVPSGTLEINEVYKFDLTTNTWNKIP